MQRPCANQNPLENRRNHKIQTDVPCILTPFQSNAYLGVLGKDENGGSDNMRNDICVNFVVIL